MRDCREGAGPVAFSNSFDLLGGLSDGENDLSEAVRERLPERVKPKPRVSNLSDSRAR